MHSRKLRTVISLSIAAAVLTILAGLVIRNAQHVEVGDLVGEQQDEPRVERGALLVVQPVMRRDQRRVQ